MLLDNQILIYAVYNHKHKRKTGEHLLKTVPTLAEAERIKRQILRDPVKACNIARVIYRLNPVIKGGLQL